MIISCSMLPPKPVSLNKRMPWMTDLPVLINKRTIETSKYEQFLSHFAKIQHTLAREDVWRRMTKVLKGIWGKGGKETEGKRKGRIRMMLFNFS
jgi:hypothetical protein